MSNIKSNLTILAGTATCALLGFGLGSKYLFHWYDIKEDSDTNYKISFKSDNSKAKTILGIVMVPMTGLLFYSKYSAGKYNNILPLYLQSTKN